MIDMTKSENSSEVAPQQIEQADMAIAQTQPEEQQIAPTSKCSKISFSDIGAKVASIPKSVQQSIDDGDGDGVIQAIQDMIRITVTAVFSSCRIISLRVCLLSNDDKNAICRVAYAISLFLLAVFIIVLFISFSWSTVLLGVECLLAAFVADRVIHATHVDLLRKGTKNRTTVSRKSQQSQYDDSDFL